MIYHEVNDMDFFRVMNCRLEREAKRARQLRVRRVRRWILRKAWREVRRGRIAWICLCVWTLCAAQWIWMMVVVPAIRG